MANCDIGNIGRTVNSDWIVSGVHMCSSVSDSRSGNGIGGLGSLIIEATITVSGNGSVDLTGDGGYTSITISENAVIRTEGYGDIDIFTNGHTITIDGHVMSGEGGRIRISGGNPVIIGGTLEADNVEYIIIGSDDSDDPPTSLVLKMANNEMDFRFVGNNLYDGSDNVLKLSDVTSLSLGTEQDSFGIRNSYFQFNLGQSGGRSVHMDPPPHVLFPSMQSISAALENSTTIEDIVDIQGGFFCYGGEKIITSDFESGVTGSSGPRIQSDTCYGSISSENITEGSFYIDAPLRSLDLVNLSRVSDSLSIGNDGALISYSSGGESGEQLIYLILRAWI